MFVRAKKVQQLTYDMMTFQFFSEGSPRSVIERYVLTAISDGMPWWVWKFLATPMVYAWFAIFKMIW